MKICEVFMVYYNFSKSSSEFSRSLDLVDSICRHFLESNFENYFTNTFLADIDYIVFPPDEGVGVKAFHLIIRDTALDPVYLIRVKISNFYDNEGLLPFDPVLYADFFSYNFSEDKKSLGLQLIESCTFSSSDFMNAELEDLATTDFFTFL